MPLPLGPKQPRGRNSREAETRSLPHLARAIERAAALRATIEQIPTFAATQRPRADALPCNGGAVSCRGWPCPNGISRPPMFLPCRGGGFRRCCGVAHDAPLPRDAAPPSDPMPLQNTLGDPSLAHHPFHGRRVPFGFLVDGVRRWRQRPDMMSHRRAPRKQTTTATVNATSMIPDLRRATPRRTRPPCESARGDMLLQPPFVFKLATALL